jgi:hypothetical protein
MVKVTALTSIQRNRVRYAPGDEMEVEADEVEALVAANLVSTVTAKKAEKKAEAGA